MENAAAPRRVQIAHSPNTRNKRRNKSSKHWRVYRDIRGKCERTVLPDGSIVFPYMEYAGKTRLNAYKTRRNSMRAVPFYTKKTFTYAPDGIYAWIDSDKGFYAALVRSKTEHGSRHAQIADRVSATEVNLAGEIEKTGSNIIFNFYSGTFMWEYIMYNDETEEALRQEAMKLFTDMGLTAVYGKTREELVRNAPTLEELEAIKKLGYNVYLYKGKDACEAHGGLYYYAAMSPEDRAADEAKLAEYNAKVADYQAKVAKDQGSVDYFKGALERDVSDDLKKQITELLPGIESKLALYRETLTQVTRTRDLIEERLRRSDRSYTML